MNFKEEFADLLSKHVKLKKEEIINLIETPKNNFGDLAFPAFSISKNPNKAAEEISKKLTSDSFERFQNTGPYINAFIKKEKFIQSVFSKNQKIKENKTIVIESPGPNTNKPLYAIKFSLIFFLEKRNKKRVSPGATHNLPFTS